MKASLILIILFSFLFAHAGSTDRYGGHSRNLRSGYHYHNAGRFHHPENPFRDHNTCGYCTKSTNTTETKNGFEYIEMDSGIKIRINKSSGDIEKFDTEKQDWVLIVVVPN